jgi:DNA-binding MarR family transcriptional regulator
MEQSEIITVCRVIAQCDLTASRVLILHAAQYNPTMGEIARETSISTASATNNVETMEKDGLVKRVRAAQEDLRKVTVEITPDGQEVLASFFARFQPVSA